MQNPLLAATVALALAGRTLTKIDIMVNKNDFGIQGSFSLTPAAKP